MDSADAENYQLIDSNGSVRTPPTQAPITVTSVVYGDRVLVALSEGAASTSVKKDQYSISGTVTSGSTSIPVTVSLPKDTPTSGFIRVVDVGVHENRYQYSGFVGNTFYLVSSTVREVDGSDTAYVPYIDREVPSGATSVQQSLTFETNRYLVGRVRKKGIIPFETTAQNVTGGVTITAIRTEDTIVT